LQDFFDTHPNFVIPEFRYNETKSFLSRGLEDFSISRMKEKMAWGIPVPGDDTQVMYVWFDALTNYISTLGWPENVEQFECYWVGGTPTQYCGKDNNRFQAIMWQAMLMAADLPNSNKIVINGHITAEGGVKMSKSLGNVVDPLEVAEKYGTDALRMFLLKEISSFEDSPFTMERFEAAYNAHLANGIGNLVSRIMTLSEKYCEPFISKEGERVFPYEAELDAFDTQKAMNSIWDAIGELDAKIAEEKPFSVVKEDETKGKEMISSLVADLHFIASGLKPFLPKTSETILNLIMQNKKPETPLFKRLD
jgi:methionyl-tRNA synthetase